MVITDIGAAVINMRLQQHSLRFIRKTLGCSSSTVSKYCSYLAANPMITKITPSPKVIGVTDKETVKAKHFLRSLKPNNPSWFNDYKARLREATKHFLMSPANGACQLCGYNKHIGGLSFHHIDPKAKKFILSGMRLTYNLHKLILEASKCNLVCHNCHSEIHATLVSPVAPLNFSHIDIPENVIIWYFSDPGAS